MGTLHGNLAQQHHQSITGDAQRVAGTLVLGLVEGNDLYECNELTPSAVAYITDAIAEVVSESYATFGAGSGKSSIHSGAEKWRRELTLLCFMLDPENNLMPKESNGFLTSLQTIRTSAAHVVNEVFSKARAAAKSEVRLGEFTNDEFALELRRRKINDYIHSFGHLR